MFTRFFKMLKMGVPVPAIKAKMISEGLNADVIEYVSLCVCVCGVVGCVCVFSRIYCLFLFGVQFLHSPSLLFVSTPDAPSPNFGGAVRSGGGVDGGPVPPPLPSQVRDYR